MRAAARDQTVIARRTPIRRGGARRDRWSCRARSTPAVGKSASRSRGSTAASSSAALDLLRARAAIVALVALGPQAQRGARRGGDRSSARHQRRLSRSCSQLQPRARRRPARELLAGFRLAVTVEAHYRTRRARLARGGGRRRARPGTAGVCRLASATAMPTRSPAAGLPQRAARALRCGASQPRRSRACAERLSEMASELAPLLVSLVLARAQPGRPHPGARRDLRRTALERVPMRSS